MTPEDREALESYDRAAEAGPENERVSSIRRKPERSGGGWKAAKLPPLDGVPHCERCCGYHQPGEPCR